MNREIGVNKYKYSITLLIAVLVGFLGIHRLINGRIITGIIMFLTLGGFLVWWIIDIVLIILGKFKDNNKQVIKSYKPFFKTPANIAPLILLIFLIFMSNTSNEDYASIDKSEISQNQQTEVIDSSVEESEIEESEIEESNNADQSTNTQNTDIQLDKENKVVDACDLSGNRQANAIVDIGFGARQYIAKTNGSGQLVEVKANDIILQDKSEENSNGRYCSDEAKVPGVEESNLDEGHVIADSLGGVSNAYNITPQESNLNRYGEMREMENKITDLESSGIEVVDFEARIEYGDTSTQIPSYYYFEFYANGVMYTYDFNNNYVKDEAQTNDNNTTHSDDNVYYENCTAVRAAGADPIYKGDPGYSSKLDRDGDGIACE